MVPCLQRYAITPTPATVGVNNFFSIAALGCVGHKKSELLQFGICFLELLLSLRPMERRHSHIDITRKQRLFAWIILLVYVPMVLFASLHVHSFNDFSRVIDCDQCHTAVHHSGHITTSSHHIDECLSCRFLGTQIDLPRTVAIVVVRPVAIHLEFFMAAEAVVRTVAHPSLRAPPSIL